MTQRERHGLHKEALLQVLKYVTLFHFQPKIKYHNEYDKAKKKEFRFTIIQMMMYVINFRKLVDLGFFFFFY